MRLGRREVTKTDIINRLAATYGYRRYLEICTTITGMCYGEIDGSLLPVCYRLMFRCDDRFDDGMAVDFRVAGLDIGECAQRIKATQAPYDIILADPWHEYATSYRALEVALDLIDARGTIIVHDCLPPTLRHATPTFFDGEWCGVTYKAFLDFVLSRQDIAYLTIDTDYGCGIIRKLGRPGEDEPALTPPKSAANRFAALLGWHDGDSQDRAAVIRRWSALGDDYDAAFAFLHEHKVPLLNLVSVRRFWRSAIPASSRR